MPATQISTKTLSSVAQTFFTESHKIYGIIVTNSGATDVTVQFYDKNDTALFRVCSVRKTTDTVDVEWIADKGLKVGAVGATIQVTVFHSAAGV